MAASWYDPETLPSFEHPPVVETAMAVEFAPIIGVDLFGLSRLQSVWDADYPDLTEVPGAPPTPRYADGSMTIQINGPQQQQRRIWAAGRGNGLLIQSQNDRLILNWRKQFSDAPYPGYAFLRAEFQRLWDKMGDFFKSQGRPPRVCTLAEYTYVNAVPMTQATKFSDIVTVVGVPDPPLPGEPSFTGFQFIRDVHKSEDHPYEGQIMIAGSPQPYADVRHLMFNVTARTLLGVGEDPFDAMDKAHALASHSFAGIVAPTVREEWGPKK